MRALDSLAILVLGIVFSLWSASSEAASVDATAAIALGSSPFPQVIPSGPPASPTVISQDPGPASANALVSDSEDEATAHGASDVGGQLAASASFNGAQGTWANIYASASWTENFVAAPGSSSSFSFHIPQALIGFGANNVSGLYGGFTVDISLNGTSIFSSTATILTTGSFPSTPSDMPLAQTGTLLTSTFNSSGVAPGFGAGYVFDPYSDTLNFTPASGDNTLTYNMMAFVIGLIGETSAIAYIGDPLKLSTEGPGDTPGASLTVAAIPLPPALALFLTGLGLVGVGAWRVSRQVQAS